MTLFHDLRFKVFKVDFYALQYKRSFWRENCLISQTVKYLELRQQCTSKHLQVHQYLQESLKSCRLILSGTLFNQVNQE